MELIILAEQNWGKKYPFSSVIYTVQKQIFEFKLS